VDRDAGTLYSEDLSGECVKSDECNNGEVKFVNDRVVVWALIWPGRNSSLRDVRFHSKMAGIKVTFANCHLQIQF
jgi:hypothetical protein